MSGGAVFLGAVIFGAFATEAMTGFGSVLLAVSFGALVLPVETILPVVVPLNLLLTGYMVLRHRGHIAARLLLTRVLPRMGLGLILGRLLTGALPAGRLELVLGILVVVAAVRGLRVALGRARSASQLSPAAERLWMLGAGVVHGMFATGGPPLVYALGRSKLDKSALRSTLASVWLVLNTALTVSFVAGGALGGPQAARLLAYAPIVIAAIALGEVLHHRVDERRFRVVVFALLLFAGLFLCAP